jgi:hypothetical protein
MNQSFFLRCLRDGSLAGLAVLLLTGSVFSAILFFVLGFIEPIAYNWAFKRPSS